MQNENGLVFFAEETLTTSLKGIFDIHGRMWQPFTLLVNMAPRNSQYDSAHTFYSSYLALCLHVDHQATWFLLQKNGLPIEFQDYKENENLNDNLLAELWQGYHGKGNAVEETTLLTCSFLDRAQVLNNFQKSKSRCLFSLASVIWTEPEKQFCCTEQNTTLRRIKRKPWQMEKIVGSSCGGYNCNYKVTFD